MSCQVHPRRVLPRLQGRDVTPDEVSDDVRPREAACLEVRDGSRHRLEVVTTLGVGAPELEGNRSDVLEFWLDRARPGNVPLG